MRSVTKQAVKEARLKEIKQELLNSEKLKVCIFWKDSYPSSYTSLQSSSFQPLCCHPDVL